MTRSTASTSRRSTATGVCRASSDWTPVLDREVAAVDLVVEADHLVGELVVAARERVERRAQRAQDEVALLLERRLELRELLVEEMPSSEPPVT